MVVRGEIPYHENRKMDRPQMAGEQGAEQQIQRLRCRYQDLRRLLQLA
jgi:hypothetical protein